MIYTKDTWDKFFWVSHFCAEIQHDRDVCQHAVEGTIVLLILFFRANWSKSQEWSYFIFNTNIHILMEISVSEKEPNLDFHTCEE